MDLAPTPEQQAVKDAVERFCQKQVTPERLGAWEREPRRIDARAADGHGGDGRSDEDEGGFFRGGTM